MGQKIAAFVIITLIMCVACGFIATVPFATRGIEQVRVDAPRHLSEVYAGPDDITIPVVWSGSDTSESYAAVVIPGDGEPTILISRKVATRDVLRFYNAGLYQRLKNEGRVDLEVDFMTYKPAQVQLEPPDPVAMAIQAFMKHEADGRYFTWVDGEVKVTTRITISVISPSPKVRQIWVSQGKTPGLFISVENYSRQLALQWVIFRGDDVTQGTSQFIPTQECSKAFCTTLQYPVPPYLRLKEKFVTGFRLLDGSSLYTDYFLGWEVSGTAGNQNLLALSAEEAKTLIQNSYWVWNSPPYMKENPPMLSRGVGQKPDNPGIYQWLEELITNSRGGGQ